MNPADDGENKDAGNSRDRFIRTVKACDDLTVGSRIEVAFAPNDSSSVNRNDEDNGSLNSGDNFLDERRAEVSLY